MHRSHAFGLEDRDVRLHGLDQSVGAQRRGTANLEARAADPAAWRQRLAAELRRAGIRAEVYLGNPKNFGNQLKYADKRAAPIAIIRGGDEKAAPLRSFGRLVTPGLVDAHVHALGAGLSEFKRKLPPFKV